MRFVVAVFAALAAACASPARSTHAAPDRIEVYVSDTMYYAIEDGGQARLVGAEERSFAFASSHGDFERILKMLAPLEAAGIPCSDPAQRRFEAGYIAWRRGGVERRAPAHWYCNTDEQRALTRHTDRAYSAMRDMARARESIPYAMPQPTRISVAWSYWGRSTGGWTIEREGEGSVDREGRSTTFRVLAEDFDRVRDLFKPYEGVHFECRRVITDGPYGTLSWSQVGHPDQRIQFDAGCVSGDAADLFARLERADAIIEELKARQPR